MQPSLINLDECVRNALRLFAEKKLPEFPDIDFKRPLVVGSGNAAVTGRILFADTDAVFADESDYVKKMAAAKGIDGAVIISASGGKHAPGIANELKSRGLKTVLLTNTADSAAGKIADATAVFPKNPEPYTYNTSTYLSMIFSKTKEDPNAVLAMLENIEKTAPADLKRCKAFYLLIPDEYEAVRDMFLTKFDELFGPKLLGRCYTEDETKHAKTLVPSDAELFISLGVENDTFGKNRFNIPLPEHSGFGTLIAAGYFFIGLVQKANPPYFKENVERYVAEASKIFGEKLSVIVE
ncbi:MAG: hypothetical protein KGH93_03415 [Patescibacteria group bacterium]|nr:hypothetical protein [Patescibacteria group bacterium]MDE1946214.1 hypothetical protein [Patescibacteria group bacterium]